jgi:hypothetical protein
VVPDDEDRVVPGDVAGGVAGAGDEPEPLSEPDPLPEPLSDPDPLPEPSDEPDEPDESDVPAAGVDAAGTVDSLAPEEDPPERLSVL